MSSSTAAVSNYRVSLVSLCGLALILLVVGQFACVESKFLRPSRYYEDDFDGPYNRPIRTGERAIVTVRGARDTYSGLPPRHMALESGPYGGYPRGVYDRLDGGYGGPRGRPYGLGSDLIPVGPYGSRFDRRPEPARPRADFLDPDFGVKASLGGKRCRLDAEADSEIPELGLDSGRVNVDCDLNPMRLAGAALNVARDYKQYRRDRARYQPEPSRTVKRKRTQINIVRDYEKSRGVGDDDDELEGGAHQAHGDEPATAQQRQPVNEQSSVLDSLDEADDEDDD